MLEKLINYLLFQLLPLNPETKLSSVLHFFLYDSVKLLLLLFILISIIGFIRSYIPKEKVKKWIEKQPRLIGHFTAAFFGAVTPFCSCSSIPIFIGFLEAGIPLGISMSFLITSPILNEYLLVLMFGYFGWKIALLYALSGILVGVFSGMVIQALNLSSLLDSAYHPDNNKGLIESLSKSFKERVKYGLNEGATIVKGIWKWILVGIAIGALIHNYVPQEFIHNIVAAGGFFTVPLATLLGVPIYGSCAAIVPVAVVLFQKGVPLGTALAFLMGVSALSLPEAIILRKAMKLKLIIIFFMIVYIGIVMTGFLFNVLQHQFS